VLSACGSDRSTDRVSTSGTGAPATSVASTTTTTIAPITTVATTLAVPPTPPPAPPTTAAPLPPITIPEPTTAPPTTQAPPPTTSPETTTTEEPTTTTKPRKPTRRTVVYTPDGVPKRKGTLVVPQPEHVDTFVVLVHGGDGTNGSRNHLREWQDFFAEHDIASLSIDYFLFKASTPPPIYPLPERDVTYAVQWATANAGDLAISPDRIVVQGFTTGAALGAQSYVSATSAPAGFVGIEGVYDGEQRDPEQYYGGPPDSPDPEVQARYAAANSTENAANAGGPALLFAAASGPEERIDQAQRFDDALVAAGIDSRLVLVPGAGGDFDSGAKDLTPVADEVAQQILTWLTDNFPPE
jgi:acetyl esterase/lipase